MATENPRMIVLDMLLETEREGEFSHRLLNDVLQKFAYLPREDRSFIKCLYEGVLERRLELDYRIDSCSKTPVRKMKPVIRNSMRMGVYQIFYMDKVPVSAACDETVKLVKWRGLSALSGFVNATMRSIAGKELVLPADPTASMSIRFSMPEELVELLVGDLGKENAEKLMEASLKPQSFTVRAREIFSEERINRWLQDLKMAGVKAIPHPYYAGAFVLSHTEGAQKLPGFAEGIFYPQDISSMMVGLLAGIEPGMQVMDLCAAPGGKTMHAADLLKGSGCVRASDVSEYKVQLIEENVKRLHLTNVQTEVGDATVPDESRTESADVVLVDAPCSGLGVLGRKPEIKYRMNSGQIEELAALQQKILTNAARYVKPGGVLVYSTCTVTAKEDEENVKWFLEHFDFRPESVEERLPQELRGSTGKDGYYKFLPGVQNSDGFFIAKFRKNEN